MKLSSELQAFSMRMTLAVGEFYRSRGGSLHDDNLMMAMVIWADISPHPPVKELREAISASKRGDLSVDKQSGVVMSGDEILY